MNSSQRTALLAGSTGLIGACLLRRLLLDSSYDRVIALSRKPLPLSHPKLEVHTVTLDTLPKIIQGLKADDWYCALGTTIRAAGSQEQFRRVDYEYPIMLGRQAAASNAEQMLIVTAMGASASTRIFYSRVKGEVERDLGLLSLPKLLIFRPSLLLGERVERRRGEGFATVVMKGLTPLLIGPFRKYRAIQADNVAAAMVAAAKLNGQSGVQIYEGDQIETLTGKQK